MVSPAARQHQATARQCHHGEIWCFEISFEYRALALLRDGTHVWFCIGNPMDARI